MDGNIATHPGTDRSGFRPRCPIHCNPARKVRLPCSPAICTTEGRHDGFFSPQLLDVTRLLVLQGERVANPDFYPMLRSLGFNNLPDQSTMAAITFCDVVVSHEPFTEWVALSRTRSRGAVSATRYCPLRRPVCARIPESGGSYEAIPLEVNAYSLGGRFEQYPANRFPVEDEVRRWIAEGRL